MDECSRIHELFRELKQHRFPFDESEIPPNGIYILFEEGEYGHEGKRIVRVGTHTGDHQLRSRLKQHFLRENKDRSIFRKNIGRALLNQGNDPFLNDWEIDLTTSRAKKEHSARIDHDYQQKIESRVSRRIRGSFSFCAFEIHDKKERLALESAIISTVSWCDRCAPSRNWLGKCAPKEKIAHSGLWLVQGLYKTPLDASGIERLSRLIHREQPPGQGV